MPYLRVGAALEYLLFINPLYLLHPGSRESKVIAKPWISPTKAMDKS
jgi:hypothetical protein